MHKQIQLLSLLPIILLVACQPDDTESNEPSAVSFNIDQDRLTTDFPELNCEGTPPEPIKIPNLEAEPTKPPSLTVPKGTALISRNKPVSSSDDYPLIGELSYITDGDKETSEGYFVELMYGSQWVQIDLEANAQIAAVWFWHTFGWPRAYHDVIVQVSNDPNFEEGVITLFNNDYDNSSGQGKGKDQPYVESHYGKLISADGIQARYVRLYSNGSTRNDANHYTEVEVFGLIE